jgi:acetylornithine deacetylase/succinyl-diaminopimelate desuccinylase-like protein
MNDVIDFIHTNRDRYVDELKAYLAIPSISALPQHAADVRRCAEWTADEMRRIGLNNVRLIETPGNPVVYGDWLGADGAPTILFYGHYDVQPVDPLDLWESPPFEATIRDGEIYARGSADDKGQVFMHLKAIEAHLKKTAKLPVNMKIILEGEEEVGSANLDDFIKGHQSDLAADVVVISDSPMFDRGIPSICYGLRGLVYFQIDVRGTKSDLHSGSFGGAVANPAMALSQLLAQMKDKGGRIKIPGFYDDVRPLRDEERAEFKKLPFNETRYRKDLGAPKLFGETGYSTLERVWARPTFEVNGLLSGFTGEGAKTVIQGQHAPRARSGSRQDREAVRGLRAESGAEDGRREGDAHARRQTVDDGLRQSLRPGGGPRDRERLWQKAGLQPRRWLDSGRRDVPGNSRLALGALRRRSARRERARAQREARSRELPRRHRRVGVPL